MKAAIIGASGYTGAELMRILHGHPEVEVSYASAHKYAGEKVTSLYPHLHGYAGMEFQAFDAEAALARSDIIFAALPHGEAMRVVPSLLEGGARVIDLSADYRLDDVALYRTWYGIEHTSAHLLSEAAYGLPEINGDSISRAGLVAVPGCYPTAAILALAPLAKAGWPGVDGAIIDAKSGVSGAGRSLSLSAHFSQADGSMKPYNVGKHRHTPEMEEVLSKLAGSGVGLTFTPHLAPMSRGILATCYLRTDGTVTAREAGEVFGAFYAGSAFVVPLGSDAFPETKAVCGSNYCHIGWHLDGDRGVMIVVSAIDNLVKGASGQAVQCMNIMQGWREDTGLQALGVFP